MSTIAIVKKNGVVAIAADTQASFGPRKMLAQYDRHAGKIMKVGDSFVGLTGWGVQQLVLEHMFGAGDAPRFAGKADIFDVLVKLHARLRQDYFLIPRSDDDAYESSQLQLMIANAFGIFGVYPNRSVIEFDRFWASGSGGDYALGAMHATYDTMTDPIGIAQAGVRAAVDFDDGSSAPIESHSLRLAAPPVEELELLLKM